MREINDNGLKLLKICEGLRFKAYRDSGGILTIGYGHTGPELKPESIITQEDAEKLLMWDLDDAETHVTNLVTKALTSNQFSALVCFVYNVGVGTFKTSTLLRKLNQGDYNGASNEFMRWNHVNGKVFEGLSIRRKAEKVLFDS